MSVEQKLDIDLNSFSLDSIKRAAYRCSNQFAFDMVVKDKTATCTLIFADDKSSTSIELAIAAFRKELLDQDLRQIIRTETEKVRNVILAHAFSRTGLVKDESVQGD